MLSVRGRGVISVGLLALCLPSAHAQEPVQRVDVTGEWRLNAQHSDDPHGRLPVIPARSTDPQAGQDGSGQRGVRGAGGANSGLYESMRLGAEQTVQLAREAPARVILARNDATVTFSFFSSEPRPPLVLQVPADGKKVKQKLDGGGEVEATVKWVSGRLTLRRKVSNGGTVTETWYRSPDNRQLFVLVSVEVSQVQKPVEFRRVYDAWGRAPAGEP